MFVYLYEFVCVCVCVRALFQLSSSSPILSFSLPAHGVDDEKYSTVTAMMMMINFDSGDVCFQETHAGLTRQTWRCDRGGWEWQQVEIYPISPATHPSHRCPQVRLHLLLFR